MGRFTANSTAIAAFFSFGLLTPAHAEIILPPEEFTAQAGPRAEQMPPLNSILQAERRAGLTQEQLSCLDGSARPCADDMPLMTPAGVSVQLNSDGQMILAPQNLQPFTVQNGQPMVRGNDLAELAEARLAAAQARAAQVQAEADAPEDEADDSAADDTAQQNQQAEATAEQTAEAAREAAEREAEIAAQIAAAQAAESVLDDEPAAPAISDSYANDEHRVEPRFADQYHRERAEHMPQLSALLQQEISEGLTADDLVCADGADRPCAEGISLLSPRGVAAEVTEDGRIIMGRAVQQVYVVGEDGKMRARGSNTEAAREAAEAAAPTAAALTAQQGEGETVTETVAEDEARSSSEDFATTLTDAIRQASEGGSGASDDGDNDSNDLARAALVGLGALAVGQMLNGNREVALNTGDRVIVTREDGSQQVLKDDNALLRQAGNEMQTENYSDGSSRTIVTRPDGSQIVTIRAADLSVLRRVHIAPDGTETVLIDESVEVPPVELAELPQAPAPSADTAPTTEAALREALAREAAIDRRFTLTQVRSIPEVRNLVAPVDIDAITFDTGSAAINPDQARQLATLGSVLEESIAQNPREIFLIEGHTDAVGSATYNLALSDRRAESVALALSEYFDVPPENLVVQGYGEEYLKIPTLADERENRRASVRRITDLLASAQ
ncbi:OmpA family protein [Paracoccus sp. SCSIO 75233]|uniref:OmpA family protein n=1 Tax=Paracoccus sp. SCSIO 75233 TaxID=3017782 RepID=UPI0022F03019|nr:OmpA family protein [Paracoccus sp. SCSIO 75233]WBU54105.1 OmpA family protein [Paracoccus sp. SCSIO 75233]